MDTLIYVKRKRIWKHEKVKDDAWTLLDYVKLYYIMRTYVLSHMGYW